MVQDKLCGSLRELEELCAKAKAEIDKSGKPGPTLLPDEPTIDVRIEAVRRAIALHVNPENAPEIVPAIQSDLTRILDSSTESDFPPPLTALSITGVVDEFVKSALPCTEADENSLVYQLLSALGNVFGTSAYAQFGADKHYPGLFQLIIGGTSTGKGQAWSSVRALMDLVDPTWQNRCKYSAASGEGLVRVISESTENPCVFAILPEISVLLNSMNREGSTLSGYLRQAWDRMPLELNRARMSLTASEYLLSCLGHVTPAELTETMGNVDFYNGISNRFLWAAVKRSKVLPRMSRFPNFDAVSEKIKRLLLLPAPGLVQFSNDGAAAWDKWVYSLTEPQNPKLAAAVERTKPNALRLALLYSLLDERRLSPHLPCRFF